MRLSYLISSPPDRENVVFEIWFGPYQLAEVSRELGREVEIEIYSHPENEKWSFKLDEFIVLMDQAKKSLVS